MAVERSLDQSRAYAADSATAGAQYGFLVKTRNCINCNNCVEACRMWNRTPEAGPARRKITAYTDSIGRVRYVSTACMHCEDPACLAVCPAGAISKGEGGIVTVNKDRCIGCKYCFQACPFDIPRFAEEGEDRAMHKCDMCASRLDEGRIPACVDNC
ncbi:MAG: 4Fe-4S dicluster domain-containing protein, partial [Eggerthellaceae bacterium]|nr:4Fe-4S dicluster domain-containing protein [Eggerthellaceae bacterium]